MKKFFIYLAIVLLAVFGALTLVANKAVAADDSYLAQMDDPNAVWWLSLVFFNGPDHNRIQYFQGMEPMIAGIGNEGAERCVSAAEQMFTYMQGSADFSHVPWGIFCAAMPAEHAGDIHLYNESMTWADDYPDEFKERWLPGEAI